MLSTYDRETRRKTAVLENAHNAVETEILNGVSELEFALPADDVKNQSCGPFQLVRWQETGQLYRLLDGTEELTGQGHVVTYSAEHVIATLIDDVVFGTLQLDNLTTKQAIERVLSFQSTKNWVVGDCQISRRFSYSWSHENLLVCLFSIPDRFDEEYRWVFDTTTYPWRIHLRRLDQSIHPEFYIRDGRNLLTASLTSKGREICTRLYALGYGEGVNQLTFASVNGGKPYIEMPEAERKKRGLPVITRIWEDLRFENPQSLLERAKVLLEGYSQPYESYSVQVADLEKLTQEAYDRAEAGKIVWFEGYKTYITRVVRHLQEVGQDTLDLANAPTDVASSIADLADRQRINSVYAQGATCLYSQAFNDNADPTHPATIRFYVPAEARQINKVILSWSYEKFRAYSVGAESTVTSTKSTTAGGKTTRTSSKGGKITPTSLEGGQSQPTSENGGKSTRTSLEGGEISKTSENGGKSTQTSLEGGKSRETSEDGGGRRKTSEEGGEGFATTEMSPTEYHTKDTFEQQGTGASHYHEYDFYTDPHEHWIDLPDHTHDIKLPDHTHDVEIPHHTHDVELPGHTHIVNLPAHTHKVEIPNHKHEVKIPAHTHKVEIPDHTHEVEIPDHTHTVDIPGHTHKTIYGIYEGQQATSANLRVDGVKVALAAGQTEIDVATKLSVESGSGKIKRGAFHTIEIVPNSLTRISATISVQLFIQSEGGGLY